MTRIELLSHTTYVERDIQRLDCMKNLNLVSLKVQKDFFLLPTNNLSLLAICSSKDVITVK